MTFGEKLKDLRQKKRMTQNEVAAFVGISRRAYASYELENIRPRKQETYDMLANLLGCDANYIRADDSALYRKSPNLIGWICPVCGRGVSPFLDTCPCKADKFFRIDVNESDS